MKIRTTLAVLILGGLTLLTGCGDSSDTSAPPPAPTNVVTTTSQSEVTPELTPEGEPTRPVTSDDSAKEFCKKLSANMEGMSVGTEANKLSLQQLETVKKTVEELTEGAPADLKPILQAMLPLYSKVIEGELSPEEGKAAAQAGLKYTEWITTHCDPADFYK